MTNLELSGSVDGETEWSGGEISSELSFRTEILLSIAKSMFNPVTGGVSKDGSLGSVQISRGLRTGRISR